MRLTFCLCHMVYKTTRKEYGILYLCLYLYCRIGILLYCCISVLSYYSLYLLFAIRLYIFFYIYISVSVSYVQPQFFSIGCAVNHHRQLFNVQRRQALSLPMTTVSWYKRNSRSQCTSSSSWQPTTKRAIMTHVMNGLASWRMKLSSILVRKNFIIQPFKVMNYGKLGKNRLSY